MDKGPEARGSGRFRLSQVMSDGNGSGRGVQAYRWMVSLGMAATVALAGLILSTVKETANDVTNLKIQFSTLTTTQFHQSSRMDSMDRRNDGQDNAIGELQRQVWQWPRNAPPVRQPEEQQRQRWNQP